MRDVRLIAVNDGVDSERGEDDFTPFRNIMNEWYAKDMSRKMRSALKIKDSQGYAIDILRMATNMIKLTKNVGLLMKELLMLFVIFLTLEKTVRV